MLAAMDPQQRADYLDKAGLQRWAPATICDREVLEEHLEHVRQSKLALDINEFQLGLACMAVPVHDQAGGVAATSTTTPSGTTGRASSSIAARSTLPRGPGIDSTRAPVSAVERRRAAISTMASRRRGCS